jgi:hypothetical protein
MTMDAKCLRRAHGGSAGAKYGNATGSGAGAARAASHWRRLISTISVCVGCTAQLVMTARKTSEHFAELAMHYGTGKETRIEGQFIAI